MFITKSSARAGATSSGPCCRPQALTTSVRQTSPLAARLIQKEISSGTVRIEAGITTTAAARARRQLRQPGCHQGASGGLSVAIVVMPGPFGSLRARPRPAAKGGRGRQPRF